MDFLSSKRGCGKPHAATRLIARHEVEFLAAQETPLCCEKPGKLGKHGIIAAAIFGFTWPVDRSVMASVIIEEHVRIPLGLATIAEFRRWSQTEDFPQGGRIDFVCGDIEVDMSPEDLF